MPSTEEILATSVEIDIFVRVPQLAKPIHIHQSNPNRQPSDLNTVHDVQRIVIERVEEAGIPPGANTATRWGSCRIIRSGRELGGDTLLSSLGLAKGEHLHGMLVAAAARPLASAVATPPPRRSQSNREEGAARTPPPSRELAAIRQRLQALYQQQLREEVGEGNEGGEGPSFESAERSLSRLLAMLPAHQGGAEGDAGVADGAEEEATSVSRRRRRPGVLPEPRQQAANPINNPPPVNSIDVQETLQQAFREPKWRLAAGFFVGFVAHVVALPLLFFGFLVTIPTDVKGYSVQYWRGSLAQSRGSGDVLREHVNAWSSAASKAKLRRAQREGAVAVVSVVSLGEMMNPPQAEADNSGQTEAGTTGFANANEAHHVGEGCLFNRLGLRDDADGGSDTGDEMIKAPPSFYAPHRTSYSSVLEPISQDFLMRGGHESGAMLFLTGIVIGVIVNLAFATFASFTVDTPIITSPR